MNVVITNITTKQKRKETQMTQTRRIGKNGIKTTNKKKQFRNKKNRISFQLPKLPSKESQKLEQQFPKKVTTQSAKMQQTQRAAIDKRPS